MDKYIIDGGVPLRGEYRIRGAKNSVLPIMAATVCKAGIYELYDCPRIGDVFAMEEILQSLGAGTRWEDSCIVIDSRNISDNKISKEMMQGMRIKSLVHLLVKLSARILCQ